MVSGSDITTAPNNSPENVDKVVSKPYNPHELDEAIMSAIKKQKTL